MHLAVLALSAWIDREQEVANDELLAKGDVLSGQVRDHIWPSDSPTKAVSDDFDDQ